MFNITEKKIYSNKILLITFSSFYMKRSHSKADFVSTEKKELKKIKQEIPKETYIFTIKQKHKAIFKALYL